MAKGQCQEKSVQFLKSLNWLMLPVIIEKFSQSKQDAYTGLLGRKRIHRPDPSPKFPKSPLDYVSRPDLLPVPVRKSVKGQNLIQILLQTLYHSGNLITPTIFPFPKSLSGFLLTGSIKNPLRLSWNYPFKSFRTVGPKVPYLMNRAPLNRNIRQKSLNRFKQTWITIYDNQRPFLGIKPSSDKVKQKIFISFGWIPSLPG